MDLIVRTENGSCECEDWPEFMEAWGASGDQFAVLAVQSADFMTWLSRVQPTRADLMTRVFGSDNERWSHIYLVLSFLRMSEHDLGATAADAPAVIFTKCVMDAFASPVSCGESLILFLANSEAPFLCIWGRDSECSLWRVKRQEQSKDSGGRLESDSDRKVEGGAKQDALWRKFGDDIDEMIVNLLALQHPVLCYRRAYEVPDSETCFLFKALSMINGSAWHSVRCWLVHAALIARREEWFKSKDSFRAQSGKVHAMVKELQRNTNLNLLDEKSVTFLLTFASHWGGMEALENVHDCQCDVTNRRLLPITMGELTKFGLESVTGSSVESSSDNCGLGIAMNIGRYCLKEGLSRVLGF